MKFVFIALILLISQAQSLRLRSSQIIAEGGQVTVTNEFVATPQANNQAQTNSQNQVVGKNEEVAHSTNQNFEKAAAPQEMKVADVKSGKFQVESLVTPKAEFINQPAPLPVQAKQNTEAVAQDTLVINVQNTFQPMNNNQATNTNMPEQIQEQVPVQVPVQQAQVQVPVQLEAKTQTEITSQVPASFQNNLPKVAKSEEVNVAPVNVVNVTPVNVTPVNVTPVNVTPVNVTPVNVTPVNVAPTNVAPVNAVPVNVSHVTAKQIPATQKDAQQLKKPIINLTKGDVVEAEDINNKNAEKDKKQFSEDSGDSYTESGDSNKLLRASGDTVSTYDSHPEFYKVSPIMVAHLEEAKN